MEVANDTEIIDNVKERIRKERNNAKYKKPTEIIVCAYCKKTFRMEKSYGTWRKGKRIMPKNRFCCRGHAWKHYSENTDIKNRVAAKGEDNVNYIKIDVDKVRKLYESGVQQKDIAKMMGVSKSFMYRRMKLSNIQRITDELRNRITYDFVTAGIPFTKLCEKYKLGQITVKGMLSNAGLNYRVNSNHFHMAQSDKIVMDHLREQGYNIVKCGNVCMVNSSLPLEICQQCNIKNVGKLPYLSFFDMVVFKDNKQYIVEVKSRRDTFSWNQTNNLIYLIRSGINVCVVRTKGDKVREMIFYDSLVDKAIATFK